MSGMVDRIATKGDGVFLLLGRVLIAALYLPSGYGKLTNLAGFAQLLAPKGLPGPVMAWAVIGAAVEFFGSLALLLGIKTRYAALLMIAFTVIAAFLSHSYWLLSDPAAIRAQQINFWKNTAIVGGLLFVFVRGAARSASIGARPNPTRQSPAGSPPGSAAP